MNLLKDFKEFIHENPIKSPSFHPKFEEALNYMLQAGGKHFRAQLLLGIVKALKPEKLSDSMSVALGLEMMHTYSLIHDDLPAMDNANLRRGYETTHVKFDEVTAILVGDALNTEAFGVISNSNLDDEIKIKCIQSLAKNAGANGMVLGQALDCYFENKALSLDKLEFLHIHKTGALIAASFEMGAIISGLNYTKISKIYDIGIMLGLVFQIQDDIIDATQNSEKVGKPTKNDLCKNSFTNLLGVKHSKIYKENLITQITNDIKSHENGVRDMVLNLIEKYLKG